MDEIAAPRRSLHPNALNQKSRRRSLNASTNGEAEESDEVPLAEFVTALSVELPQLELWIEEVRSKLAKDAQDVQTEIESLRRELRRDHDPHKMQLIQEMISVCTHHFQVTIVILLIISHSQSCIGSYEPNVTDTRTSQ